jgi:CRISPR type III-B/RAMP module-associated protein Cmr3
VTCEWLTWSLDPRDPLVFGSGARTSARQPAGAAWLPPQATAAGAVRSTLAGGGTRLTAEEARGLLEVRIRGPWLVESGGHPEGALSEPWVPVPADSVLGYTADGEHLVRGELIAPARDEGVSGRKGAGVPPLLVDLPRRWQGRKTGRPSLPFRPLSWVVGWSLGDETSRSWGTAEQPSPLLREDRVHLGIEDGRYTAQPEALFGTAGVRFASGFRLAIEVSAPERDLQAAGSHLLVVGGEGRVSELAVQPDPALPGFDRYRQAIERRINVLASRGSEARLGVKLQLLSPASFGGWRPEPWPSSLCPLDLQAVAIPGFEPISGWNLQGGRSGRGAPRRVQRLVPAGSVYFLGPVDSAARLAELCESLWGRSLCDDLEGDADRFLAPPVNDGYGTVLPLPCLLPPLTAES